ncbi:hypothetical protein Tco_0909884 [Tanacetum coccineum]|uniref:Uncharacterized protein n=1 Tax=Tanacetum coccineum TaxID=301880 RepID=A0ABQ5CXL2_9ASTR
MIIVVPYPVRVPPSLVSQRWEKICCYCPEVETTLAQFGIAQITTKYTAKWLVLQNIPSNRDNLAPSMDEYQAFFAPSHNEQRPKSPGGEPLFAVVIALQVKEVISFCLSYLKTQADCTGHSGGWLAPIVTSHSFYGSVQRKLAFWIRVVMGLFMFLGFLPNHCAIIVDKSCDSLVTQSLGLHLDAQFLEILVERTFHAQLVFAKTTGCGIC